MRDLGKIAARCWRAISDLHTLKWLFELVAGTGFTGIWTWAAIRSYIDQQPLYLVIASAAGMIAGVFYCTRVAQDQWRSRQRTATVPRETALTGTDSEPKLFAVEHVVPAYKVVREKEYFDVTVTLRFLRPITGASILLDIYGAGRRTIDLIKNENYAEGAERRLIVARIPRDPTEIAVWGPPDCTENPPLVAGSNA